MVANIRPVPRLYFSAAAGFIYARPRVEMSKVLSAHHAPNSNNLSSITSTWTVWLAVKKSSIFFAFSVAAVL